MHARSQAGAALRPALGLALAALAAATLAACGSGSSGSGGGGSSGSGGGATASSAPASSAAAAAAGSGGGSSGGTTDPCQVVTASEAARLVGKAVRQTGDANWTCTYLGAGALVTVTVRALPASATAQAQTYYNKAVQQLGGRPGVKLSDPGIGDKSLEGIVSVPGIPAFGGIAFLKGTVYVGIVASPTSSTSALKALATVALGRV